MRFSKEMKAGRRPVTPRRVAAAVRALKRERDKVPLFAEEVAAEQPTPEQRVERLDQGFVATWQEIRNQRARVWRKARARLRSLPPDAQAEILARWNRSTVPGDSAYFADFVSHCLVEWLSIIGINVLPLYMTEEHVAKVIEARPWVEHPWCPFHVLALEDGFWKDTRHAFRTHDEAEQFGHAEVGVPWRIIEW